MKTHSELVSAFSMNLLVLKIFGLYPFESWSHRAYTLYAFVLYFTVTVPVPVLAALQLVISNEKDLEVIADSGFLIIQLGILLIKHLPFKMYPSRTKRTVEDWLNSEAFNNLCPDQKTYIEDILYGCRSTFWIYQGSCIISIIAYGVSRLINIRTLPENIWLPFDPHCHIWVYIPIYIWTFIGTIHTGFDNCGVDSLIFGLTYQATGQLKILKDTIKHLGRRAEEAVSVIEGLTNEEKQIMKSKIIYENICKCIHHHIQIKRYVQELEETYSIPIICQFVCSVLVICITTLRFTFIFPSSGTFIFLLSYLVAILVEIFIYCYGGTLLYEESLTLNHSVYESDWIEFDESSKKALLILLEGSKKPLKIRIGKLIDMSVDTFVLILRRSYTLLCVLENFDQPQS